MNKPLLVGITGGMGAGKSIIAQVFQKLGAPVYDADSRAKSLMSTSATLVSSIKNLFGEESYKDSHLNREHIASMAFNDPALLNKLNDLVHPVVAHDFGNWISNNSHEPYLVKEAALLFETGSHKSLDKLILVTAPKEIRLRRVLNRDAHRNEKDVLAIMEKQLSDEEKHPLADIVLTNDGTILLIPQILKLHEEFSQ